MVLFSIILVHLISSFTMRTMSLIWHGSKWHVKNHKITSSRNLQQPMTAVMLFQTKGSILGHNQDEWSNMPDRRAFSYFFNAMDMAGMKTLTLDAFLNHDDVKMLVEHGSLTISAIKKAWFASYNHGNSLNEDDAYNVLCKIMCSMNHEQLSYLEQEFYHLWGDNSGSKVTMGEKVITFTAFLKWDETRELMRDYLISEVDIQSLWQDVCGSMRSDMSLKQFLQVNNELSELFVSNVIRDDTELTLLADKISSPFLEKIPTSNIPFMSSSNKQVMQLPTNQGFLSKEEFNNVSPSNLVLNDMSVSEMNDNLNDDDEDDEDTSAVFDLRDVDVWEPSYDPRASLDAPFLNYLEDFFFKSADVDSSSSEGPQLSFRKFSEWKDLKDILADGQLDVTCLKDLWLEAVQERKDCQRTGKLDLDTFLRLNIRIEIMLHEVSDILDTIADDDFESYHRKEFQRITNGSDLLVFEQLLQWPDLTSMVEEGVVTLDQVRSLWMKLPREILRPYRPAFEVPGEGGGPVVSGEAINLNAFLAFSASLHDLYPDY